MKELIKATPKRLVITIAVLLVLIAIALAASDTLGRYISSFDGSLHFSASGKESVTVFSKDNWNNGSSNVVISNASNASTLSNEVVTLQNDVSARVRLYIPTSHGIPGIYLEYGGEKYTGQATLLQEGTEAYATYGEGYIYQFFRPDGKELTFSFKGGEAKDYEMKISLGDEYFTIPTENFKTIVETVHTNGGDE